MKTFLTSIFLLSVALVAQGNSTDSPVKTDESKIVSHPTLGKNMIVDRSIMECVYSHRVYDPYFDKHRTNDEILEIGRKASLYGFYGNYRRDSIVRKDYPEGMDFNEFQALSRKCNSRKSTELIKDIRSNKLTNHEGIFMDHYYYEEEIPQFEWNLNDESDEICGQICKKATTTFRGRNWIAWYCPNIQSDNGPWKFGGLPGLILKIEDDKKEHVFEAIQIRKSDNDFGFHIWSFKIKTDRKKFNKMMLDYKMDVGQTIAATPDGPKFADGSPAIPPNRRLFYNPIEKD